MTVEDVKSKDPRKFVTVCDECLTTSCWQGKFMCQNYPYAGTVNLPVSTLMWLNLESRDYFVENASPKSTHHENASIPSTREPEKGFEEELTEIIDDLSNLDFPANPLVPVYHVLIELDKRGYIRKEGK